LDGYNVHIEARAPDGVPRRSVSDETWDRFMDNLVPLHGSLAANEWSWSAQVTVDARSAEAAAVLASRAVLEAVERSGGPLWPIVRCEVVREDVFDEDLAKPQFPPASPARHLKVAVAVAVDVADAAHVDASGRVSASLSSRISRSTVHRATARPAG
jgi:hypothetical protein